ncbi:hypothetical protein BD779DRAFT_1478776 [Infundibulicybe gibba]|nr:hypothetical protein BD779DRAFT_1478776 [Infundibulicybe gibba]
MAPGFWATEEQLAWLRARVNKFIDAQLTKTHRTFWSETERAWFLLWPGEDSEADTMKKRLKTWFHNNSAKAGQPAAKIKPFVVPKAHRVPQPLEYYSREGAYESKIGPVVREEIRANNVPKNEFFNVIRRHTQAAWDAEPDEVKEEVLRKVEALKEARGRQEHESADRKDYAVAIESASLVAEKFLEDMYQKTGLIGSLYLGGPDPVNDGRITTCAVHTGVDRSGKRFNKANPSYREYLKDWFDFVNSAFHNYFVAPEVRAARAAAGSAMAGTGAHSANALSVLTATPTSTWLTLEESQGVLTPASTSDDIQPPTLSTGLSSTFTPPTDEAPTSDDIQPPTLSTDLPSTFTPPADEDLSFIDPALGQALRTSRREVNTPHVPRSGSPSNASSLSRPSSPTNASPHSGPPPPIEPPAPLSTNSLSMSPLGSPTLGAMAPPIPPVLGSAAPLPTQTGPPASFSAQPPLAPPLPGLAPPQEILPPLLRRPILLLVMKLHPYHNPAPHSPHQRGNLKKEMPQSRNKGRYRGDPRTRTSYAVRPAKPQAPR